MAAVLRVKRRLDEEPLEAFVLSCKKRKISDDVNDLEPTDAEVSATLLKFAGTVKEDENFLAHLKKQHIPEIHELREHFKKHTVNISDKLRTQAQENSKTNRYRIVNCFRSQHLNDNNHEVALDTPKSEYTVFEVETDVINENLKTDDHIEETCVPKYVYDLYYTNSDDFGDTEIEDYVSIYPLSDPLLLGSTRDNGLNIHDSDDDSEDSNAENNWRNDYPDESDIESINEDDMIQAIEKIDISEDLLSSDDGEEGFVYSIDSEAAGFEEDIDESDVYRYGEQYARFKAKHKKEKVVESTGLDHDFYYGDIDENEYYY